MRSAFLVVLCLFAQVQANPFVARTSYCPQWSPDGKQILFYSHIGDHWRILQVAADGSHMKLLSTGTHNDYYPSFSPDGQKILFYSNRDGDQEIYTMNTEGSNVQQLTHNDTPDRHPRWSPDGKRIAYVCASPKGDGICIIKPGSSAISMLINPAETPVISRISWSPNGSQIIFYSSTDKKEMNSNNQWALFAVSYPSGIVKRMDNTWRRDSNPHWSAANKIAFDAHVHGAWESDDGGWEIFEMNPDGTGRENLTRNQDRNDWAPAWSPDGKKIAYCSGRNDQYEIFVMNADGSASRQITHLLEQKNSLMDVQDHTLRANSNSPTNPDGTKL